MSRHDKTKINYTQTFICEHCARTVAPVEFGTEHRNHCPFCLHSRHMDLKPGDRRSGCRGLMVPISIWVKNKKEWALIHRCEKCGFIRPTRIAGDDNEVLLFTLAAQAMTMLPFPADKTLNSINRNVIIGGQNEAG